jgi:pimeloyl-ACP methyl ester carboxylesterase
MATFVIAHGAWSAAWAWKKMRPLMREAGHVLVTPTNTGLGERWHLSGPEITLDTHVADVLGVIEYEGLTDITLVGHSYGGMVATGVADRVPGSITRLVYLDAFVPRDGQCLFDLHPPEHRRRVEERARSEGEGYLVPANPPPPDTPPEDLEWIAPRRKPQPIGTMSTPVRLTHGESTMPRHYIYCTKAGPGDSFRQFAMRARAEPGWRYYELESSHNPHITVPRDLMQLLDNIARS